MLPGKFKSRMQAIAKNRRDGAIELAIKVIDTFLELKRSRVSYTERDIERIVKSVSKAQPSMVPIHNSLEICEKIIFTEGEVVNRLGQFKSYLKNSREIVAEKFTESMLSETKCITLSRSSTVLTALQLAAKAGKLCKLVIMESRPRYEGRITAKEMRRHGVNCTLVADALGPSLVGEVDMAVVGSDAVLKDGAVVNKIGTYPLSLACTMVGRPLYVLAESIKLDSRYDSDSWPGSELRDKTELLPPKLRGMKAINRYFDLTLPAYIHAVVHEGGISRKHWVAEMEKELQNQLYVST